MDGLLTNAGTQKLTRTQLATIPTPAGTDTHHPVPHIEVVNSLLETLAFRHINIVSDEYAVSPDGMKMFGFAELETTFEGCRFALGLRNSHDKSMRLGLTVGFRVMVCMNMAFSGDFSPVLTKHSKHFNSEKLRDDLAIGVDRMQRNFEPMQRQVAGWRESQLTDDEAKVIIYRAFVEDQLEAPKHIAKVVHKAYFEPEYPEFAPRTLYSLHNAFTSSFKVLDAIPQFKATAALGGFLNN